MATLYVILHGAWALVDNKKEPDVIHACAPVIAGHSNLAGSWPQFLAGAAAGKWALSPPTIPSGHNLVLQFGAKPMAARGTDGVRKHGSELALFKLGPGTAVNPPATPDATVHLPRPVAILPRVKVPIAVTPASDLDASSGNMALVPVFMYSFDAVSGTDWPQLFDVGAAMTPGSTPAAGAPFWRADPIDGNGVTTLHLWAAEQSAAAVAPKADFQAVSGILGYSTTLTGSVKVTPGPGDVQIPDLAGRGVEVTTFLFQLTPGGGPVPIAPGPFHPWVLDQSSCGGGGGGS